MTLAQKTDFALTGSTPLGLMTLGEEGGAIVALSWGNAREQRETALLRRAWSLLARYFTGEREAFDLPLRPAGTAFERSVWAVLRTIPWGERWTYGEVARLAGGSPRAVGRAVGSNPIPIMIPCHRVVAADGLGGFSAPGGVATKRALLARESNSFPGDLFADTASRHR
ncbi:MAG: methylated-DNA--[protein]-cysteine S-methyltransferase [Acetobacteraceae bacterium]